MQVLPTTYSLKKIFLQFLLLIVFGDFFSEKVKKLALYLGLNEWFCMSWEREGQINDIYEKKI